VKLVALALLLAVTLFNAGARAQTDCIGSCLEQLNICRNSMRYASICEDAYEICAEGCIGN
jgi:hypothetical protein